MLRRWIDRLAWRRSHRFEAAVIDALDEIERTYGAEALSKARQKTRRRHQPVRRKWIWREVVRRLEARQAAEASPRTIADGPA